MSKKKLISIITCIVGVFALVVGVVFLIIRLNQGPSVADGEYLVSAENWTLVDGTNCAMEETNCVPSVIWTFEEIGKGTLTTNNHVNDYDFIWSLEGGKLKMETDWLYTLENEYDYTLDQNNGVLILRDGEEEITFQANFAN